MLTFTNNPEQDITTKNPVAIADHLYIALTNVPVPVYATASIEDLPVLANHRWRYINEQVVTTVLTDAGYEAPIAIQNVLLGKKRDAVTGLRNGLYLDARRSNLIGFKSTGKPNRITINRDVATIHTADGTVTIDAADVPLVKNYQWSLVTNGKLMIRAQAKTPKGRTTMIQLPRLLLGATSPTKAVTYLNGDRTDCRRANLVLGTRK